VKIHLLPLGIERLPSAPESSFYQARHTGFRVASTAWWR